MTGVSTWSAEERKDFYDFTQQRSVCKLAATGRSCTRGVVVVFMCIFALLEGVVYWEALVLRHCD